MAAAQARSRCSPGDQCAAGSRGDPHPARSRGSHAWSGAPDDLPPPDAGAATADATRPAIRRADSDDIPALIDIENRAFVTDRLSRRAFRYLLSKANAETLAEVDEAGAIRGYAIVLFNRGTSLARLYSIAVDPRHQRLGLGRALLKAAVAAAAIAARPIFGSRCVPTPATFKPSIVPTVFGSSAAAALLRGRRGGGQDGEVAGTAAIPA